MRNIRLIILTILCALTLISSGCAILRLTPESFEATPKAVNDELRYVTLHTDQVYKLEEGDRYTVRRLYDDAEMADLVIKSVNRKVLLADVLWAGWEPTYQTNFTVVLTYKED